MLVLTWTMSIILNKSMSSSGPYVFKWHCPPRFLTAMSRLATSSTC